MDWAAVAAIGTVLGGLALPLAFIQIDAQRRERLRAQVCKVGAWTEVHTLSDPERPVSLTFGQLWLGDNKSNEWVINVFVRNSSDLPLIVHRVEVSITTWGMNFREKTDDSLGRSMSSVFDPAQSDDLFQGYTFEPGSTKSEPLTLLSSVSHFDRPQPPKVSIKRIVVTDAAGLLWELRPALARPPKRVYSRKR
jgi:hypothetical protein